MFARRSECDEECYIHLFGKMECLPRLCSQRIVCKSISLQTFHIYNQYQWHFYFMCVCAEASGYDMHSQNTTITGLHSLCAHKSVHPLGATWMRRHDGILQVSANMNCSVLCYFIFFMTAQCGHVTRERPDTLGRWVTHNAITRLLVALLVASTPCFRPSHPTPHTLAVGRCISVASATRTVYIYIYIFNCGL